ncbi:MAG: hypothetical protein CME24_15155 [Gemmatimonadetes bacterium]|nr:hypothetical protein [Gemmatimonadota bacterium]
MLLATFSPVVLVYLLLAAQPPHDARDAMSHDIPHIHYEKIMNCQYFVSIMSNNSLSSDSMERLWNATP